MIYDKQEIQKILFEHKTAIEGYGVKRLGLFGSYTRNEQNETSDLDFVAEFYKEKKNYKNFISLCYFLEDTFGKKVDLITFESLPKDRKFTENVLEQFIIMIETETK